MWSLIQSQVDFDGLIDGSHRGWGHLAERTSTKAFFIDGSDLVGFYFAPLFKSSLTSEDFHFKGVNSFGFRRDGKNRDEGGMLIPRIVGHHHRRARFLDFGTHRGVEGDPIDLTSFDHRPSPVAASHSSATV